MYHSIIVETRKSKLKKNRFFSSLKMAAVLTATVVSVFSFAPLKADAAGLGAVTINSVSIAGEMLLLIYLLRTCHQVMMVSFIFSLKNLIREHLQAHL